MEELLLALFGGWTPPASSSDQWDRSFVILVVPLYYAPPISVAFRVQQMKTEHPASSLFHPIAHLLQQRLGMLCVLEDGKADPGGHVVCGVILRPLHRWDRGYESR